MINPKNKIVMLPMDTTMSKEGFINDFHIQHYGARMYGGVGTIIIESTAVSPEGRITLKDLGLWNDNQIEGYTHLVRLAKITKTLLGIQLGHAASRAYDSKEKIYISKKFNSTDDNKHINVATEEQIKFILDKFVQAAKRAEKAGFDFFEIHAAHGYFFSELISPITNEVNPSESIVKRSKYLLDLIAQLKKEVSIPFGIRLSVNDYYEKGNTAKDFKPLIEILEKDVLYFNVSSYVVPSPLVDEAMKKTKLYRLNEALVIKSFTTKPVIASGNINTKEDIEYALSKGVDYVGMGRELLQNPYFVINNYVSLDELKNYDWNNNKWFSYFSYLEGKKNGRW